MVEETAKFSECANQLNLLASHINGIWEKFLPVENSE